jgi:quaternary ammonium compound-resistance protein SugE
MTTSWIMLIIAGLSEVGWAYYLKKADGFTQLWPSLGFLLLLGISMGLLAFSIRQIPIGIAYPIWTGIGAIGAVAMGIMFFSEPFGFLKCLFVTMIIVGIVGLKIINS